MTTKLDAINVVDEVYMKEMDIIHGGNFLMTCNWYGTHNITQSISTICDV